MKQATFWILLVVFFLTCVGQIELSAQQRFKGGLVAGVNLAQLDGDNLEGYNKLGFNAGGRVSTILTERWQLSIEILYSQLGSSRSNNDYTSPYDRIRLNYVEVPVMMNFKDWKLHFSGGLVYGRLIDYSVEDFSGQDITDIEEFNSNALSIILGATYFINENWGISGYWQRSLLNIEGDPDASQLLGRNVILRGLYFF